MKISPLEYGVSLFKRDVEGDLDDGVVEPMVLVVRLQDVALRGRAGARVLGQIHVRKAQLAEVATSFLLL